MLITPQLQLDEDVLAFPNLVQWIERYLDDCRLRLRSDQTLLHYGCALKRFSTWYESRLSDGHITRQKARDFVYWLSRVKRKFDDHPGKPTSDTGLSPVTVRRTIGVVRTFLTWLYEERCLPRDFSFWFPLPQVTNKHINGKTVSTATLQALLDAAAQSELPLRDVAIVALLADTGLRRTELATLRVEQVHWLEADGKGCLHEVMGKGERMRMIPFSAAVGQTIRHYVDVRRLYVQNLPDTQELFVQQNGQPLQADSIYQVLRRIAKRAGVEDQVWNTHSLRHSFATHFWQVQRDTKSLSIILGHSSQKITEDIYVHPSAEDLMDAHISPVSTGSISLPKSLPQQRMPPCRETLAAAIRTEPNWRALGRQFDLSDVGVRKLAQRYGLLEEYQTARQLC
jgi:integrase/recombinase XerD